jgi:hypothetical protein
VHVARRVIEHEHHGHRAAAAAVAVEVVGAQGDLVDRRLRQRACKCYLHTAHGLPGRGVDDLYLQFGGGPGVDAQRARLALVQFAARFQYLGKRRLREHRDEVPARCQIAEVLAAIGMRGRRDRAREHAAEADALRSAARAERLDWCAGPAVDDLDRERCRSESAYHELQAARSPCEFTAIVDQFKVRALLWQLQAKLRLARPERPVHKQEGTRPIGAFRPETAARQRAVKFQIRDRCSPRVDHRT